MGRLIAVGDIHGCLDALNELLDKLEPTSEDNLVFLGDYVDRGPDSRGVVERLMALQSELLNTVCLRGNHDDFMVRAFEGFSESHEMWVYNGGHQTLDSYGADAFNYQRVIPREHITWLKTRKLTYYADPFVFVHAGLSPYVGLRSQLEWHYPQTCLWDRDAVKQAQQNPGKPVWGEDLTVVCGHTPLHRPLLAPDLICIDTGACYPVLGQLSAVVLPEREIVQVEVKKPALV